MAVAAVAIRSAFPTTAAAAAAPALRPAFLGVARAAASSRRRRILLPAWPVAAMSSSSSSSAAAAHKAGAWYAVPDLSLRDHRFAVPLDHSSPSPSAPTITVFAREVVAGESRLPTVPRNARARPPLLPIQLRCPYTEPPRDRSVGSGGRGDYRG